MGYQHVNFADVTPGSIIDGGGLAVFLRQTGAHTAECINLIGCDAGSVSEWGDVCEVVLDARFSDFEKVMRAYGVDHYKAGHDERCEEQPAVIGKLLWREYQRHADLVEKSIDQASPAHASLHQEVATLLKTASILTERAAAIIDEEDS